MFGLWTVRVVMQHEAEHQRQPELKLSVKVT